MKEERWYEIQGDTLYVYDAPYKSQSSGSSIVHVRDMPYYRANFRLRKIWGTEKPA